MSPSRIRLRVLVLYSKVLLAATWASRILMGRRVGLRLRRTWYTNGGHSKGYAHNNSPRVPSRVVDLARDSNLNRSSPLSESFESSSWILRVLFTVQKCIECPSSFRVRHLTPVAAGQVELLDKIHLLPGARPALPMGVVPECLVES